MKADLNVLGIKYWGGGLSGNSIDGQAVLEAF